MILTQTSAKSSLLDYIPTSLIKLRSPTFSELIAYLANLSLHENCFTSSFTQAIVTPLLKSLVLTVLHLLTIALFPISITSQKSLSVSFSFVYSRTSLPLPTSTLYSQLTAVLTPLRRHLSTLWTTSTPRRPRLDGAYPPS